MPPFFSEVLTVIFLLDLFARIISILLDAVVLAMILRVIMPFIVDVEENRFYLFLTVISEPFVMPVRFLLAKFNILQDSPIDWSFTFTYIMISIIQALLPALY